MNLSFSEVRSFNEQTKSFWCIQDFKSEIIDWSFNVDLKDLKEVTIGHPINSHKGTSVGDVLPYTILPEELRKKYPNLEIYVPDWFSPFFDTNPYISGIKNNVMRWGSLGTWGTTVQRTCNVWGIKTFSFSPKIYNRIQKNKKKICFSITSKTGGQIQNLKEFEYIIEHIKKNYHCTQICLKNEPHIRNADSYIFNISKNKLIDTIGEFEYYIGAQNSLYHLSKSLGSKVIGILPENIDPNFVILPMLTQINEREIEMLSKKEKERCYIFIDKIKKLGKNPYDTHHIGWLYPDSVHLTMRNGDGILRCPYASPENILSALHDEIYPFNDQNLWNINSDSWR